MQNSGRVCSSRSKDLWKFGTVRIVHSILAYVITVNEKHPVALRSMWFRIHSNKQNRLISYIYNIFYIFCGHGESVGKISSGWRMKDEGWRQGSVCRPRLEQTKPASCHAAAATRVIWNSFANIAPVEPKTASVRHRQHRGKSLSLWVQPPPGRTNWLRQPKTRAAHVLVFWGVFFILFFSFFLEKSLYFAVKLALLSTVTAFFFLFFYHCEAGTVLSAGGGVEPGKAASIITANDWRGSLWNIVRGSGTGTSIESSGRAGGGPREGVGGA